MSWYRWYTTLEEVKRHQRIVSENAVDDEYLTFVIASASAIIARRTCRDFVPTYVTREADYMAVYDDRVLRPPADPLMLESVTNGDGLAVSAWTLTPPDGAYEWVELPQGAAWTFKDMRSRVSLVGWWGYHPTPAEAWASVGALAEGIDAEDDEIDGATVTIETGDYIRIGDELLFADVGGLARGVNGTVAAAHSVGATIQRWRVAPVILWATTEICAWMYKNRDRVNEYIQFAEGGGVRIGDLSPAVWHAVDQLSRCGDC